MIYFDENKEAYNQLQTLQNWGKTLIYQCSDEEYDEFLAGKRIWQDDTLVLNPNYEEELAQKEKERVALLKMTPRDFLLAITSMGIDWSNIKALMAQNPQVEIELNYCQYVYRGNPLLDDLCGNFGVTPEQLDEIFKEQGE